MAGVVLDSGVAIKWFVAEPHSAEARRVLDAYRTGAVSFLAPDLINAEVGNVAWKKHVFQKMDASDAEAIVIGFRMISIGLTSTADLLEDAYRLAVVHRRTVYDMAYLALSVRERCPFVTADEKLFNAVRSTFPSVVWLANWP
jgi:predicted nucleic acid-binding protein